MGAPEARVVEYDSVDCPGNGRAVAVEARQASRRYSRYRLVSAAGARQE